jgi:hypothetical protein
MTTIKVIFQNFGSFIEISNTFLGFSKSNFVTHPLSYSFFKKYFVTNILLKYIWNKKIISWKVRFYKKNQYKNKFFMNFWKKYVLCVEISYVTKLWILRYLYINVCISINMYLYIYTGIYIIIRIHIHIHHKYIHTLYTDDCYFIKVAHLYLRDILC